MSRPCASSAFAFTNTSNAVSVPRRAMRLARRSSRCAALCITANQAVPAISLNSQSSTTFSTFVARPPPDQAHAGGEGCAVAAAAMVFKFYGIEIDPQKLNWFLTSADGYTENGWIYWDRAAWFAPDRVRHVYEDLASYQLIDSNLARGNPVIVRVRLPGGVTHFVVIAGKDGFDYLVRDPGAGAAKGLYPLRELGSEIEALRFYQPIAKSGRVAADT